MAESAQRLPCVRCGDFVETASGPGVPVCPSCLEGVRLTPDHVWVAPPWRILWLQVWPSVLAAALAAIPGAAAGFFLPIPPGPGNAITLRLGLIVGLAFLASFSVGSLAFAALYFPRRHVGHSLWKRSLLQSLGFHGGADDPGVSLAYYAHRRPLFTDRRLPLEPGLLIETPIGLAFFGAEGTRQVFPFAAIQGVSMERLVMWPPRRSLRLDLRGASPVFFALIEELSMMENSARAEAIGRRIRERLGAA